MPPSYLPNEPVIADPVSQSQLTDLYLAPVCTELKELFTSLRRELDRHLQPKQPIKLGKPYPLGQCLEISQAFVKDLSNLKIAAFTDQAMLGALKSLQVFIQAGGEFRQVWGDLRGEYFQNAFILGTWYVDVANDTVNPNKPPVEIMPFSESGLRPIQNFAHFAVMAKRYWKAECLPNLIYPELAPFFPLIVLQPNAAPQLHGMFDYMIALTMRSEFRMSEEALKALPFPEHLFHAMSPLDGLDVEAARALAVNACAQARQLGHHASDLARHKAVKQSLKTNQALKTLCVQWGG